MNFIASGKNFLLWLPEILLAYAFFLGKIQHSFNYEDWFISLDMSLLFEFKINFLSHNVSSISPTMAGVGREGKIYVVRSEWQVAKLTLDKMGSHYRVLIKGMAWFNLIFNMIVPILGWELKYVEVDVAREGAHIFKWEVMVAWIRVLAMQVKRTVWILDISWHEL